MSHLFENSPVCVISFNRPDLLRQTLLSIKAAMAVSEMRGPVILFQDNNLSPYNKINKSNPIFLDQCKQKFLNIIPFGVIFEASENLGIARNIYRAEKWAFEEMKYDLAFFFEDDMVISETYFEAMRQLNNMAEIHPQIGMFSAYGVNSQASAHEQHRERKGAGPMHHNWAFGLRRSAWLAREEYTHYYMDIISGADYRFRPAYQIALWYTRLGWPPLATNQDIAKNVILNHMGMVRVTTNIVLGKYIGEIGEHYTTEEFDRLGFRDSQLYGDFFPEEPVELAMLEKADIELIWSAQREALLNSPIERDILLRDTQFSVAKLLVSRLDVGKSVFEHRGRFIESYTGIYSDLWFGPSVSIILRNDVEITRFRIKGSIASHLPLGVRITFFINGKASFSSTSLEANLIFDSVLSWNLRGLTRIISFTCEPSTDPFSAGAGKDRRPICFHINSLTIWSDRNEIEIENFELAEEFGFEV